MPAIADLVPAAGLSGVIVVLIGYLLRQLGADRVAYREQITAEQARTAAADARAEAERARADAAQKRIDDERELRREAESAASAAAAELRAVSAMYSREVSQLHRLLPAVAAAATPGELTDRQGT